MKRFRILPIIFAAAIVFSYCKKNDEDNCIQGNGNLIQETRDVDDYTEIYASGAFNISFSQINNSQVDLFGDSNILPIITTTVSGNVLNVGIDNNQCYSTQNTIEVTATAQGFEGVTLDGAGKIEAHNIATGELHYVTNGSATINSSFTADNFSVTIMGSGDGQFAGSAENAELTIGGAGNIQAAALSVNICDITIEGTGDISIHVNNEMNVVISGSGNVYYTGDPDINSNISGTGQIIKVD
jgi:hypothetical protein